jgi:hypothetical protein
VPHLGEVTIEPPDDPVAPSVVRCVRRAIGDHPLDREGILTSLRCVVRMDRSWPPASLQIDATAYPDVRIDLPILSYGKGGARLEDVDGRRLVRHLRHEFAHVVDRRSAMAGFDQGAWIALPESMRSDAYRLWDMWIDGRLARACVPVFSWRSRLAGWRGDLRTRVSGEEARALRRVWSADRFTFADLVALAGELSPIRSAAIAREWSKPDAGRRLASRLQRRARRT